jgi:hypothetical protein
MKLLPVIKIGNLLVLTGLTILPASAQQKFKYKTAVDKIDTTGFYNIELQAGLTGKCQTGLADIRLMDEQGKPVPYVLASALPHKVKTSYRELTHLIAASPKDSLTSYIAANKQGLIIDRLWIKVRNTAVNRTVDVLGSDDFQHWFAIREHIALHRADASGTGTFEELITLPASTYRYLKIEVNDKNRVPINIIQAGIYKNQNTEIAYIPVPRASLISKYEADTSFISISFKEPCRIDKLHLQIAGTKYFRRKLQVYALVGKNRKWLKDTIISSAGSGNIYFSARASRLLLIVLNEDNPPLTVQSAQAYQLKQSLVAYLNKEHQYQIFFGSKSANIPQYDLQFFKDSIGSQLPAISHAAIIPVHYNKHIDQKGALPDWLLWIAGIVALLILLLLTLKMTKEVSKKDTSKLS